MLFLFYNNIVCIFEIYNITNNMGFFRKRNRNAITKITYNGIGFEGLLAIAFIVLKLCNVINWSWGWVLAPIWIPIALGVIIFIIVFSLYVWLS